jgi:hypothetical protein
MRSPNAPEQQRFPSLWPVWSLEATAFATGRIVPIQDEPLVLSYTLKVNHPRSEISTINLQPDGSVLFNHKRNATENNNLNVWINYHADKLITLAKTHGPMSMVGHLLAPACFHVYYIIKGDNVLLDDFSIRYHITHKDVVWPDSCIYVTPATPECVLVINQKDGMVNFSGLLGTYQPGTPFVGLPISKLEARSGTVPRIVSNHEIMRTYAFVHHG